MQTGKTEEWVSVMIPTHNRAGCLRKAMASVVAQTYRPLELIIVDDGSTDSTPEVVAEFLHRNAGSSDFRVMRLTQRSQGGPRARNAGFQASRGQYVRFLDDDDWLEPDATRIQVGVLRKTHADVCYGDWRDTFENISNGDCTTALCTPRDLVDPIGDLLGDVWYPSFCYLLSRDAVEKVGGWSETYAALQDRDFINRVAYAGARFVRAPVIVGSYYHHSSVRVSRRNRALWNACMKQINLDGIEFLEAHGQWNNVRRRTVASSLFTHARRYFDEDRAQFRELLALMRRIAPHYHPGKWHFKLLSFVLGLERTETLRRKVKRTLRLRD